MRYITIIILLLSVLPLTAQDNLENSFSIELSKKIFPKFTIALEEDFRLRDNFQEIDRFNHARNFLSGLQPPESGRRVQSN